MNKTPCLICFMLFICLTVFAGNEIAELKERTKQWKENKEAMFLENKGQLIDMEGKPVPFVLFKTQTPGMDMYVTEKGLTYVFLKIEKEACIERDNKENDETFKTNWERIDMEIKGASIKKENVIREGASEWVNHYYLGHFPNGIRDVHSYDKIIIKEIYPGIDWVLYNSNSTGFKYDFIVHPEAEYKQIELLYRTKNLVKINEKGGIDFSTKHGHITENAPISFSNGEEIKTKFIKNYQKAIIVNNDNGYEISISFHLNSTIQQFKNSTLVIDPQLVWATFIGGNKEDGPECITTDLTGNVFISGYVRNNSTIPLLNPFGGTFFNGIYAGGNSDLIILKFSNAGILLWSTFYGGSSDENARNIVCDMAGNVFICGFTQSINFPLYNPLGGAYYQSLYGGGKSDAFILKFDNNGVQKWATFYGGNSAPANPVEDATSICVDNLGNIFVGGYTDAPNLPLFNPLGGAYYQSIFGGSGLTITDAFILKFDNNGVQKWATYYGGNTSDRIMAITSDLTGNVFCTGSTSNNFILYDPGLGAYYQSASGGSTDLFILKFDNNGVQKWATYYGSTGSEVGMGIITDGNLNVYITGITNSTTFPLLNSLGAYFQPIKGAGGDDAFILKFDNNGIQKWGTYYGGTGTERFDDLDNIAIDGCDNIYISFSIGSGGNSGTIIKPECNNKGYNDATFNGGLFYGDASIAKFTNGGKLLWATYLGGDGNDYKQALATDANNNLYITGEWKWGNAGSDASYPLTDPLGGAYFDAIANGEDDGYIVKFIPDILTNTQSQENSTACNPCNGSATINLTCSEPNYNYVWSNGSSTVSSANATNKITGLCAGNYTVTATSSCNQIQTATFTITGSTGNLTLNINKSNVICSGDDLSATAVVAGGNSPYTYIWSPTAQTAATATGLIAGITYTLTITDTGGCTAIAATNITSPTPLIGQFTKGTVKCIGCGCKEWIMVTAIGGTSPYSYAWPDGYINRYKNHLCPGNYTVNIKDKNGCSINVNLSAP